MSTKQKIILAVASLVILVVGWVAYDTLTLHEVSSDPASGAKTDFTHTITVRFNHPISQDTAKNFTLTPGVKGTTTTSGSSLSFVPTDAYTIGTVYRVSVLPVGSDGKPGRTYSFSFTPNAITMHEIPNTLVKALPVQNEHLKITYDVNPNKTLVLHVTLFAILNRPSQLPQYNADIRAYKQEALAYITAHGGDLKKLTVLVTPDPDAIESDESNVH